MDYPPEVITKGTKGKAEARIFQSSGGSFIIYSYRDIASGKSMAKYSILLRRDDGKIEHLFIIPGVEGKELVVKHTIEVTTNERGVFDEKSKKVVHF